MKIIKTEITKNKFVFTGVLAVCINFIIECLNRRGFIEGVVHIFTAPYIFVLNTLIVAFTLSFAYLFRKRNFMFVLISMLWLFAGIADYIIRFYRKTPFNANDFTLISDAVKIIGAYINVFGIILIAAGFVAAIICIIYYWKKSESCTGKIMYIRTIGSIGFLWMVICFMIWLGLRTNHLQARFGNITTAYREFGFAYCFTNSIIDNGIDEPRDYDKVDFIEIKTNRPPIRDNTQNGEKPNVIFLQLESFMNPWLIKGVSYTENPVPNFNKLYNIFPSGYLLVPSFGAGTANTEFEVMTGMNLDDFGTGEYPYKTVLKNHACETICYNLKETGYKTHALHNNDGSFYNRYRVLPNLGFDTYTSIEYMGETKTNPIGWSKDEVLTEYITKILDSTDEPDFIYAISVQGHGDYPSSYEELDELTKDNPLKYNIKVNNFQNEDEIAGFEYYISQVKEMDDFIGELTLRLSKRREKTILVFYGDHLPGFTLESDDLISEDIYKSQYVIWSNYDAGFTNKNLEAFQLSSYILEGLGNTKGVINLYHQKYKNNDDYLEKLTMIEYDILYGDKKLYDNQEIYEPTDMQMGIYPIEISKAYNYNEHACIEGANFNKYCFVSVNDKEYLTECVNPHTLVAHDVELVEGDVVKIVVHGKDNLVLSETEEFIYHPE